MPHPSLHKGSRLLAFWGLEQNCDSWHAKVGSCCVSALLFFAWNGMVHPQFDCAYSEIKLCAASETCTVGLTLLDT